MQAKEAYTQALALGFRVPCDLSDAEIERVYNGVGADWMPLWIRVVLTWLFGPVFAPAIFTHDFRYSYGVGTLCDFCEANAELDRNGRICADVRYGKFNPLRYAARALARKLARTCNLFGLPAYLAAIDNTKQAQKTPR